MRKKWNLIGTITIILLLVWLLYKIDLVKVYKLILETNILWLILSFITLLFSFIIWSIRWTKIFEGYVKPDKKFFLKVLLAGEFFNTITPGAGIGGEPFKAYIISKRYKKSNSKTLGYVLGDTFFKLIIWGFFIIFSASFILIFIDIPSSLKITLELLIFSAILISTLVLSILREKTNFNIGKLFKKFQKTKFLKKHFKTENKFEEYLNLKYKNSLKTFKKTIKDKRNISIGIPLSFAFWMLQFLSAYFVFLALHQPASFISVVIVFTLGTIIGSLSPFPGGIGTIESSTTLLYSIVGIAPETALLAAFVNRFVYYILSLLIGGKMFLSLKKTHPKT